MTAATSEQHTAVQSFQCGETAAARTLAAMCFAVERLLYATGAAIGLPPGGCDWLVSRTSLEQDNFRGRTNAVAASETRAVIDEGAMSVDGLA